MKQSKQENTIIQEILSILPQHIGVTQIKYHKINSVHDQFQVSSIYQSSQRIPINQAYLFEEVSQKLEKISTHKQVCEYFLESLHPIYENDDNFIGFHNLTLYEEEEFKENQKLEVTPDILNLLIFWSISNAESIQLMKQLNSEITIELSEARIISINIDSDQKAWEQFISEQENYDSYYFNPRSPFFNIQMKALSFKKFPHVVILDKQLKVHVVENTNLQQIKRQLYNFSFFVNNEQILGQQMQQFQQQIDPTIIYSKQDFNALKHSIKTKFMELMNAYYKTNVIVELRLIKKKNFFKDGSKVVIDRSKVLISIEQQFNESSQNLISSFEKECQLIFGVENYLIFKKAFRKQETEEQIVIKEVLNDFVSQFQLQIITYQWEEHVINWNYEQQQFIIESNYENRVKFDREISTKEYQEVIHQLTPIIEAQDEDYLKQYTRNIAEQLISIQQIGDKFYPIDGYYHNGDKEIIIQHNPQQMLVLIWLMPCAFIIIKLEGFQKKLQEQYGDKIRIVFLGLEYNKEDIDYIYKFKPNIEFYYLKDGIDMLRMRYNVKLFPYQIIIDQNGIIRQKGLFHQLEQKIAFEFATHPYNYQQSQKQIQLDQLEDFLLSQKTIAKDFGSKQQFCYQLCVRTNPKQELTTLCKYTIRQKNKYQCNQFNQSLQFYIPIEKLSFEERLIASFDIPYPGKKCSVCGSTLNQNFAQYYNFFKNEFYCCQCAEKKDHLGIKYQIKDNVVFINSPITDPDQLKDIDAYRFGKNIQPIDHAEAIHNFFCIGCSKQSHLRNRYIVINDQKGLYQEDGYTDFCMDCFQKIKNKSPEWKNFANINDNSVFLRITAAFGYNIF